MFLAGTAIDPASRTATGFTITGATYSLEVSGTLLQYDAGGALTGGTLRQASLRDLASGDIVFITRANLGFLDGAAFQTLLDLAATNRTAAIASLHQTFLGQSFYSIRTETGGFMDGYARDDTLEGSFRDDILVGRGGNDSYFLGAGDDVAIAGDGDDLIFGFQGNKLILAGNGNNRVDIDTVGSFLAAGSVTVESGSDPLALLLAAQVLQPGGLAFDFGDGDRLWLVGLSDVTALAADTILI